MSVRLDRIVRRFAIQEVGARLVKFVDGLVDFAIEPVQPLCIGPSPQSTFASGAAIDDVPLVASSWALNSWGDKSLLGKKNMG